MKSTRWYQIGAGLLLLSVAGCTRMSVVDHPADYMTAKAPTHIWVTTSSNSKVEVVHPKVQADTLSGFTSGKYFEIPLSDVKVVEARTPNVGGTLLLAGASAGAITAMVVAVSSKAGTTCQVQLADEDVQQVC